jgi:hypothetical protein
MQVSAHSSTARIMLMSSCRLPSSLIRSAPRAAIGPRVDLITGWQQPLTVKFLLGVVSKLCALHGRPLFRITAARCI